MSAPPATSESPLLTEVIEQIANVLYQPLATDEERRRALAALRFTDRDWTVWAGCYSNMNTAGSDSQVTLMDRLDAFDYYRRETRDHAADRLAATVTCRDVLGWLCAAPSRVGTDWMAIVRDYAFVPNGWVYYAAGIAPAEASATPVKAAVAMAALRGFVLPEASR